MFFFFTVVVRGFLCISGGFLARISEPSSPVSYMTPRWTTFGEASDIWSRGCQLQRRSGRFRWRHWKAEGVFFCVVVDVGTTGSWLVRQVAKNRELFLLMLFDFNRGCNVVIACDCHVVNVWWIKLNLTNMKNQPNMFFLMKRRAVGFFDAAEI